MKAVSNNINDWLLVYLLGLRKGEMGEWCGLLDINITNKREIDDSWKEMALMSGKDTERKDLFTEVICEEYENYFLTVRGMKDGELLAIHPHRILGFTGMYSTSLIYPIQFIPVLKALSAQKWVRTLQPPLKTISGQRFPAQAGGR